MKINFKKKDPNVVIPKYETIGASGLDIRANIEENIVLKPLERKLIPTGLIFEIQKGHEVQIRPRSGLSIKHGITLVNCVGTIDSDYRGEIKIPLINLSEEEYTIKPGERVAQIVVSEYCQAELVEVSCVSETRRNNGGFGSTGKE